MLTKNTESVGVPVIDDSFSWKLDLERAALDLERRKSQRRWSDASFAKVEKVLFTGAFGVRKLIESQKVSDEVEASTVSAKSFAFKARYVDRHNRDEIERLYDLSKGTSVTVGLEAFCNQLIHSFVLTPMLTPQSGMHGVFVASDRERVRRCLFFTVESLAAAFRRVAHDDLLWF